MPIPDFQSCMRPLLDFVSDGEPHQLRDAYDSLSDFFELTQDERDQLLPSGRQTIIKNRIGWSRTFLQKAGLLSSPGRGLLQITDLGLNALTERPERVDIRYLTQFDSFMAFYRPKDRSDNKAKSMDDVEVAIESQTPEERLQQAHSELTSLLVSELLQSIKEQSPAYFETLVVDLMLAMGYGGSRQSSGFTTPIGNDNGIDGIINEDKLGLDTIYLQAKRWENTVQRPEIDKFIGALTRQGARKGVFITTSDFSSGATQAAQGLNLSIVLIDGERLANLMIEHNLGVTIKESFQIKAVDSDYFSDE